MRETHPMSWVPLRPVAGPHSHDGHSPMELGFFRALLSVASCNKWLEKVLEVPRCRGFLERWCGVLGVPWWLAIAVHQGDFYVNILYTALQHQKRVIRWCSLPFKPRNIKTVACFVTTTETARRTTPGSLTPQKLAKSFSSVWQVLRQIGMTQKSYTYPKTTSRKKNVGHPLVGSLVVGPSFWAKPQMFSFGECLVNL